MDRHLSHMLIGHLLQSKDDLKMPDLSFQLLWRGRFRRGAQPDSHIALIFHTWYPDVFENRETPIGAGGAVAIPNTTYYLHIIQNPAYQFHCIRPDSFWEEEFWRKCRIWGLFVSQPLWRRGSRRGAQLDKVSLQWRLIPKHHGLFTWDAFSIIQHSSFKMHH